MENDFTEEESIVYVIQEIFRSFSDENINMGIITAEEKKSYTWRNEKW